MWIAILITVFCIILVIYGVLLFINSSVLKGFWKLMDDCAEEHKFGEMSVIFYGRKVFVYAADPDGKILENAMYKYYVFPTLHPMQATIRLCHPKKITSMLDRARVSYNFMTGKLALTTPGHSRRQVQQRTFIFLKSPAYTDILLQS